MPMVLLRSTKLWVFQHAAVDVGLQQHEGQHPPGGAQPRGIQCEPGLACRARACASPRWLDSDRSARGGGGAHPHLHQRPPLLQAEPWTMATSRCTSDSSLNERR